MATEKDSYGAVHRFARISPQKARVVMDVIRGCPAEEAITKLRFLERRASPMIHKVLRSAIANAEQAAGIESENLVVWRATVDEGPRMKRWKPRAQGRAYPRTRRMAHLSIVLREVPKAAAKAGSARPSGDAKEGGE